MPIPAPRRILGWVARGLGVALLLALFWQAVLLTQVVWWSRFDPGSTSFMRIRLAELREADPRAELRQQWVPYERISIHLKRAVVAAEDDRFLDHDGFDWEGIERALERNAEEGRVTAGGSTISQQLAKNLFLSGERTAPRKAQEIVVTYMLEALLPKSRILEIYLNHVEWGEGVFGAQAAARHHFRVDADQLAPMQAARLAVMLPAPKRFEKRPGSAYVAGRAATIAARMGAVELP